MNDQLADGIAKSCLDCYKNLPKTGKPLDQEWTVLSCIVQFDRYNEKYEVVSLGTGSKCIGAKKMSGAGNVLNDSHAEVIARRGFLVYLYENIENKLNNKASIFTFNEGQFRLKPGIDFVFYSSQLPCGDASILPKPIDEVYGQVFQSNKRPAHTDVCDIESKKSKLELVNDIHRTGAKCLVSSEQDPKESGVNYHTLGQVRTKPGRGDETLSVSCSDKIARWIHVGIQGALLDILLADPICIKHFIFGAGVPYSEEALDRALLYRNGINLTKFMTTFQQCSIIFPHKKSDLNSRPAPTSIIWIKTGNKNIISEATTHGVKLGLIKKRHHLVSAYLCISKYKLYQKFLEVLKKNNYLKFSICGDSALDTIPYNEMKRKAERYYKDWENVKKTFFKTWTKKPDIWNFCVNNT